MTSAIIASFAAVAALGFLEGLGRFYPARKTWWRLRRTRGRSAVVLMRARCERAADPALARRLASLMVALVIVWIGVASLLDKRWHEVLWDVTPYLIVSVALLRTPRILRSVADRMKEYEKDAGEDPDVPGAGRNGNGPEAVAL
ncbi:MAG TPA: hypothetical protein VHN37_05910 [Actinomycetota bacterium]|nr:hypothetical protein [Actinomycetota bacterium]